MLDSGMVRRKKEKKKRLAWEGIVLPATPEGWRFMIQPVEGGMLCGRLGTPINTAPQDARAAAAAMVVEPHHTSTTRTSRTAQVTLATGIEPVPSGTGG